MKMTRHIITLFAICTVLSACDHSNFPAGPEEASYTYDSIIIPGLDVPTISVRTANKIGQPLANNELTKQKYYIAGIVTGFNSKHETEMNGSYHNAIFYMRDNTTSALEFECYRVRNIDNTDFESLDQIAKGDTVVVYGYITRYNQTIETSGSDKAWLYWSSNSLAYPEKDVKYIEDDFREGLGDWTIRTQTDCGFDVWKYNKTEMGTTSAMAQAVDASGAMHACEAWLVSPAINLTEQGAQSAKLAFQHYYNKGASAVQDIASQLSIKVSTDDGATWSDNLPITHFSPGNNKKYVGDTLDISAYISPYTRVAFVYKSTELSAPLWSVRQISIYEHKRSR